MKYARLRVHHDPDTLHPMHAFEMDHEAIERASLLHWNTVLDETNTMVFRVRGDPAPFRAKLEARDATEAFSLTDAVEGVFYCCVRDRVTDADRGYIDAFARGTLVVVPPVEFEPDGTTAVTLVGTAADLDAAVTELPDGLRATIESVGPYRRRAGESDWRLTDRQREAVAAAVECGYYDSPRSGTVADVADDLDIAPGTAAEHLRKAEATVMRRASD
ncbi:Predicted DNA binding protein, contains HTH domain [Haloplanus vescus]|uniref:Predicted DNA binding protein, contains HTH domain n=1 Tax=Haloplanus vescus TaxID=555874 RepID=A0A1H3W1B6_9EURY|nr:helix-turn-helix domain-containing protein [Haloplanus vescus]SDZ80102.1 Predicted DNA binding protein, contains HTH domain [Haloplanus vescus]